MSFLSPEPTAAERSNGTGKFPLKVARQCRVSSSTSLIERDLSTGDGAIFTFPLERKKTYLRNTSNLKKFLAKNKKARALNKLYIVVNCISRRLKSNQIRSNFIQNLSKYTFQEEYIGTFNEPILNFKTLVITRHAID